MSVDSYLAMQTPSVAAVLSEVRAALAEALPAAEQGISYQIPVFRVAGRDVVYFAAFKHHYSLYPVGAALRAGLGSDVEAHLHGKATLRFRYEDSVPVALIQRVARGRLIEITERPRREARRGQPG